MKTLINITAVVYIGTTIARPLRTYAFLRPSSAKKPTWRGAERMIARALKCRPSDVSVERIEAMCYDA